MNEQEIKAMIDADHRIKDFVSSEKGYLEINWFKVPIVNFKEDKGASFYYKIPLDKHADYKSITSFMEKCMEYISDLIEQEREKNLCVNPERKHFLK